MEQKSKEDLGFTFSTHKNGDIVIFHHGKAATRFRGKDAIKYINQLELSSFNAQQLLMAKLTGNYKRGNERSAKKHLKPT